MEQEVDLVAVARRKRPRDVGLAARWRASRPGAMHVWPATARPILTVVYLCPTEGYKGAQHACIDDQVQTGRKRLCGTMCACQTCNSTAPPRETGTAGQDVYPCPTSTSPHRGHIQAHVRLHAIPEPLPGRQAQQSQGPPTLSDKPPLLIMEAIDLCFCRCTGSVYESRLS